MNVVAAAVVAGIVTLALLVVFLRQTLTDSLFLWAAVSFAGGVGVFLLLRTRRPTP